MISHDKNNNVKFKQQNNKVNNKVKFPPSTNHNLLRIKLISVTKTEHHSLRTRKKRSKEATFLASQTCPVKSSSNNQVFMVCQVN